MRGGVCYGEKKQTPKRRAETMTAAHPDFREELTKYAAEDFR